MGKRVYEDKWIKVRIDEFERNGEKIEYTILERQDVCVVIPVTSSGEIVFVEEFRYPVGKNVIGLPMGAVDEGESGLEAANRELKEETGLELELTKIGFFPNASSSEIFLIDLPFSLNKA